MTFFGGVFLGLFRDGESRERFAGLERFAMFFRETVFANCLDVGLGAVTDMLIKTILWVFLGEFYHVLIAGDFGDDGSGGDFANFSVGLNTGGRVIF